jgi:hypothetical protein
MVLFLHEPQLPGGTDKFLLLEPFGVAGHNQLMPEIRREKQFRIYDRDITRFAQIDEHTVKLSLVGKRVSYLFCFQTPTDCLSFMKSVSSDAKTFFQHKHQSPRGHTPSRAQDLCSIRPPQGKPARHWQLLSGQL